MASNRIKKLGGNFTIESFKKVLKQLNGRALLVVTIINKHCEECVKLQKFIGQLENGFIDKLPQLVMLYGFNSTPLNAPKEEKRKPKEGNDGENVEKKQLSDTRILTWDQIPEGHGYAVFLSENDIQFYRGDFNHDEYVANIIDNIRRFKSSIKTLAGLTAKNQFIQKKRTGIIIETSGATQHSQIMELEEKVKAFGPKLKTPVYFCKGFNQEMVLVLKGEVVYKQKGYNLPKFLKKVPK
ncbi:hypothetical protein KJ966_25010 [bacterium]|nr:hypothetical protein [bacterium]